MKTICINCGHLKKDHKFGISGFKAESICQICNCEYYQRVGKEIPKDVWEKQISERIFRVTHE